VDTPGASKVDAAAKRANSNVYCSYFLFLPQWIDAHQDARLSNGPEFSFSHVRMVRMLPVAKAMDESAAP